MLNLEEKAKLGKEVMVGLVQGVSFEIVVSHIVLTCMKAGEPNSRKLSMRFLYSVLMNTLLML